MTPFLLSFLLLFTIVVAFVFGIALGYWAVCGILYFFNPDPHAEEADSRVPTSPPPPAATDDSALDWTPLRTVAVFRISQVST